MIGPSPSNSDTRYRHRMRCPKKSCGKRVTLRRHPDEYDHIPLCPACGTQLQSRERERRAEKQRQLDAGEICHCSAAPFRHVAGTVRYCERGEPQPDDDTPEAEHAWQAMWERKRTRPDSGAVVDLIPS